MTKRTVMTLLCVVVTCVPVAYGDSLSVVGDWVCLCKEGETQWDLTVLRAQENGHEVTYGLPHGRAVDDEGLIYVCDTFGNRIFVFSQSGKRLAVVTDERLYHPFRIEAVDGGFLLLTSVTKGKGEDAQFLLSRSGKTLEFHEWKETSVVADDARTYSGAVSVFGKNGLAYLRSSDDCRKSLVLVDGEGEYVKSVPSKFVDKQNRYYRSMIGERDVWGVYDESGKLQGKFAARGTPRRIGGWIYFLDKSDEERPVLRRYSKDGSSEQAIELVGFTGFPSLVSPNGEHMLRVRTGFKESGFSGQGVWIQKLEYQEGAVAPSE